VNLIKHFQERETSVGLARLFGCHAFTVQVVRDSGENYRDNEKRGGGNRSAGNFNALDTEVQPEEEICQGEEKCKHESYRRKITDQ
jgi:hypothetical protein